MLVLSRRPGEKILFPTLGAAVQVVAVKPGVVRLGIQAPPQVTVLRAELQGRGAEAKPPARSPGGPAGEAKLRELEGAILDGLDGALDGLARLRRRLRAGLIQDPAISVGGITDGLDALRRQVEAEGTHRPPRPTSRPRRALLVEDDPNERELLAGFLRTAGLEVDTAGDGVDGLEHLRRRGRPDVLLLDMVLPRCDGPTTVGAIRHDPAYAGLKIFGMSGYPAEEFRLARGPGGVDGWYDKPLDPSALLGDLNRELGISPCPV
jgi:carbon storage regulator CsrA